MGIFVGTFQLDNGLGEFFRSTASRALTLANKIALRTSHGHFVDDEHRSCWRWTPAEGAPKSGQTRRARCKVANYEARRWPTERDPSKALQASVVPHRSQFSIRRLVIRENSRSLSVTTV